MAVRTKPTSSSTVRRAWENTGKTRTSRHNDRRRPICPMVMGRAGEDTISVVGVLSESQLGRLEDRGYLELPGLMGADLLATLRQRVDDLFAEEGDRAGWEFKQEPGARRLANLVNKGKVF